MSRSKTFDQEKALDAAIDVFREYGFEGTSTGMLVDAMSIGRQSLYDTYGDKWQLYLSAVRRYGGIEIGAHLAALSGQAKAIDGIKAMIDRVVWNARSGCLGVGAICEFGIGKPDLNAIHGWADRLLRTALVERVREAQNHKHIGSAIDPNAIVDYLVATFAGIRIAARGGASDAQLQSLAHMAIRALL